MAEDITEEKPVYKPYPNIDTHQIHLDDEKKEKLLAWIDKKKEAVYFDRVQFVERQERYFSNFDDFVSFTRKGPWDDSSNVHLPLTEIILKSYFSRLYNIFSSKDITKLTGRDGTDEVLVNAIRKLREWYVYDYINEYRGIRPVVREVMYDVVSVGYGLVMKAWDIKQRKIIDLVPNRLVEETRELDNEMAKLDVEEGEKADISQFKEITKIVTSFEGSKLFTIPFEDCYFPNLIHGSSDLNQPPCVIVQSKGTAGELKLKEAQGLYDKEAVKFGTEKASRQSDRAYAKESDIKDIRDNLTGYQTQFSHYDEEENDVEYCFCTYDIDDDDFNEEIVVTRIADGPILNVNYLDRTSKLGKRPVFKFDCFTKPRQAYSRGIPEFMYPIQEAVDRNFNMRMDSLQLSTMPWGVVSGTSMLNDAPIKVKPGHFVKVDDVNNSLKTMSFPSNPAALASEEDRLFGYAERLSNTPPHSQGSIGENVGPLRSTSGLTSLLQQINKEFTPMVEHNADSWRDLEMSLLEDLEFRVDPKLKMRVLGADLEDELSPMEFKDAFRLTAMIDMKMDVASVINSEEFRRNDANTLYSLFTAPSLMQQFGIITPKGMYRFASDVLKEFGKNPEDYLEKPQFVDRALSIEQEIQICAQLTMPPMSAIDEHEEKAEALIDFLETEEFKEAEASGAYPEEWAEFIKKASDKHLQMAAAMQGSGPGNPSGANSVAGADQNAQLSGQSPQQGGTDPNQTTARGERGPAGPEGQPAEGAPAQ